MSKKSSGKGKESPAKLGATHASGMFRQGIEELRAAFYFHNSNIAQPTVYGIVGTKTPGEVMEDRKHEMTDPNEKPSILTERLQAAQMQHEQEVPNKEQELDRD